MFDVVHIKQLCVVKRCDLLFGGFFRRVAAVSPIEETHFSAISESLRVLSAVVFFLACQIHSLKTFVLHPPFAKSCFVLLYVGLPLKTPILLRGED